MNDEVEIEGTFDSEDTAADVARALNRWFAWVLEGDQDDIPELFEDFGVSTDDYALDRDSDVDWSDPPHARASGPLVLIRVESGETLDLLQELVEALGAYEVNVNDEVEDVETDDDEEEDGESGEAEADADSDDIDDDDG